MGTARIAVVTSEAGMRWDTDLRLIVEALRDGGMTAEAVAWDTEALAWGRFDSVVIRSTWDYAERLGEFLDWVDATTRLTRLWNPASVVRWNSDKRYLLDLAERGVGVVPTRFMEPGAKCAEEDFRGAGGVVVKPAVSAGALDTARYEPARYLDAEKHACGLLDQGRVVMVQPYLRLVEEGERALVFLSGAFSHAIRKGPVLTEPGVIDNDRGPHPDVTPYAPTVEELGTAQAALAAVPSPEPPLFARVDLAMDDNRTPVVMELELIEPNLFLGAHPRGLERFVAAVKTETQKAVP
ncbi:hypothetical protein AB0O74_32685 [Streptomyces rubiginosohelvolus]|uniref:ATP-grasp domain-containing protein n=1 Tax=Streptomyces rubiginosohelvolus TaxID=67362 RepID=UPI00342E0A6C